MEGLACASFHLTKFENDGQGSMVKVWHGMAFVERAEEAWEHSLVPYVMIWDMERREVIRWQEQIIQD